MRITDTGKRCALRREGRRCGGRVLVEMTGSGEFRWEAFCEKCGACDVNGYRTKREAMATDYFEPDAAPLLAETPLPCAENCRRGGTSGRHTTASLSRCATRYMCSCCLGGRRAGA
jgi:hypothetical protein